MVDVNKYVFIHNHVASASNQWNSIRLATVR